MTVLVVRCFRDRPWLFVGWLWFLGVLAPMIGLLQVGDQAGLADRYSYIAQVGLFWPPLSWGNKLQGHPCRAGPRMMFISIALLCGWGVAAYEQAADWHDSMFCFSRAIEINDRNHWVHNNLGFALLRKGRKREESLEHFARQSRLCRRTPWDITVWASVCTNCAIARGPSRSSKRRSSTIRQVRQSINDSRPSWRKPPRCRKPSITFEKQYDCCPTTVRPVSTWGWPWRGPATTRRRSAHCGGHTNFAGTRLRRCRCSHPSCGKIGKLTEARAAIEELLTSQPQIADGQFLLGEILRDEGNITGARDSIRRSSAITSQLGPPSLRH